jgi:hypothetical protein
MNAERSMHPRQRLRYLKAGGFLAVVILILLFLVPGEREKVEKYVGGKTPWLSVLYSMR